MKILLLAMVGVAFAADHPDPSHFLKYLSDIGTSKEYLLMTQDDQKFFKDLVAAAKKSPADLNAFITANSFAKILQLTDHLDEDDIPHFEELLAYYADPTVFNGHHKRQVPSMDLLDWMREMHLIDKVEEDLDHSERVIFMDMMFHLEHGTLTQYIAKVGYAEVLRVLSRIDEDYEHQIDQMILKHLQKEAAMGGN